MPEHMPIPPEHVFAVLCRTEHGRAMWRAAQYEALAEIQQERIEALERQKAPAAQDPASKEPAGQEPADE